MTEDEINMKRFHQLRICYGRVYNVAYILEKVKNNVAYGHPLDDESLKLLEDIKGQVAALRDLVIVKRLEAGSSVIEVAKDFGLSESRISQIRKEQKAKS